MSPPGSGYRNLVKRVASQAIGASAVPPPPPAPPTVNEAEARVRAERDSADAQRRKRGRLSTVITGATGVSDTPLGFKTLVGS